MTDAQQSNENPYHVFPYGAESPYVPRPAYGAKTRIPGRVGHQEDLGCREDQEYQEDREHQNCMQSSQECGDVPLLIPTTDVEQSNENRYQASLHKANSPHVPAPAYETETRASTRIEHQEDLEYREDRGHQNCM